MDYLEIARKAKANFQKGRQSQPETAKPIYDGRIIAVLIDSPIVGPVWFALDDGWKSGDDTPVFYASELPHLQTMTPEELRKRYKQKLALGGGWIRGKIEEQTRH
jgi:hypothetical protein